MKQQLSKFKTQYDQSANYNHKGLFEAKKEAYSTEIDVSKRIVSHSEEKFTLKPLEINFVQSLTLKDDPKFQEIQKIFTKYNAEVAAMKTNPADGLHLKKVVMDSMLKFLRMMMLAPDIHSRKVILDLAYYWFIKHLNPKLQKKSKTAMISQIKQIISENSLLPKAVIQKELPSSKLANDLYMYKIRARTQYQQLDAPEFQLQNYQIHKVTYMSENEEREDNDEEKKKKKLMRVKFPKPNLDQYYLPPEQEIKYEQKVEITPQQPEQTPAAEGQKPVEGGEVAGEAPVGQQVPENAQLAQQMDLLNQMGGEPQQPEQAVIEQEEDKGKGKLDPFVKVFLRKQMMQKQKQGAFEHPPINYFERYRQNYKDAVQREDQNFARKMNEWTSNRCRFKTQIARKIESIKMYHNQTVTMPQQSSIESVFYQTRINEAIRDGRRYLKGQLNRQSLNTEGGLSCFDRRRAKTLTGSTHKPFSRIIQQNKRVNQTEDSLLEIEKIKQKFAKKKIFTSMQAMKGGLMHPQERGDAEQPQKIEYPVNLLSNPFFVGKKKKKKGKKKKK